ncbi:MAG: hypothetical protein JL50_20095 [Peptococcaceae bacterium BICA1-7]|nr:MAG: hypothetical protein JL50_20095 [Peptococcaceae bacterium BICA1-7]
MVDSFDQMRQNLYSFRDGYYLAKNDPSFWEKLLKREPNNEKAMYHVGLKLKQEAIKYLKRYRSTEATVYFAIYNRKLKEALAMFNQSLDCGYILARKEVLLIEAAIKQQEKDWNKSIQEKPLNNSMLKGFLICAIIVLMLLAGMTIVNLSYKNNIITENTYFKNTAYLIPYDVVYGKPPAQDSDISQNNYEVSMITLPVNSDNEDIVNSLLNEIKSSYTDNPKGPKKVVALDGNQEAAGMAIWPGEPSHIKVYVYPPLLNKPQSSNLIQENYPLWETATVIRSALYQFTKANGFMPKELSSLTASYPNNYLSSLPKEPITVSNKVSSGFDGSGGWLYEPIDIGYPGMTDKDLQETVKRALQPNISPKQDIPFSPVEIFIDKSAHLLTLLSQSQIISRYPVALGKNNKTPEGSFFVEKKIMNPNKNIPGSAYGTRAMELSDERDAIHGTNDPGSMGQDATMGCIRMQNKDIEELYSLVPLYSPVTISTDKKKENGDNDNPEELRNIPSHALLSLSDLYKKSDNPLEEDNGSVFNWNQ